MKKDNLSTKHIFIFVDKEGETAYFYFEATKKYFKRFIGFFFFFSLILAQLFQKTNFPYCFIYLTVF